MSHRPSAVAIAVLLVSSAAVTPARADDQVCNDGYEQGQVLRKDVKLLEARERFRACVNTCILEAKKKACGEWLAQVDRDIPTVVLSAKDAGGAVLVDVVVTAGGQTLATKLEGRSIEVNPGVHTFSFQAADGTKKDIQVVVEQGKKDTPVEVTLGAAPPVPPPMAGNLPGNAVAPVPVTSPPTPEPPPPAQSAALPWKTIGLVTAGVGVVGLGLGTVFGLQASSKKSDAGCDSNSVCPGQMALDTLHDAHSAGDLSTLFFVVGGLLAAGGVTMWVLAPSGSVQAAPSVGQNMVGMMLKGTW
jgi:hypothetical protein